MTRSPSLDQVCITLFDCLIISDTYYYIITPLHTANINDRSMKGDGDSELVVFFEDKTMVDGMMNGEPYKAGEFSRSLRYNLLSMRIKYSLFLVII